MVLSIMVPHFPDIGSGGVPPVPPTILTSGSGREKIVGIIVATMFSCQTIFNALGHHTHSTGTKI